MENILNCKDDNYCTSENDFFLLVQAGLGVSKGRPLSANPDWGCICKLAAQQSVIGIVADGINKIKNHYPAINVPQEYRRWYLTNVVDIDGRNSEIASLQSEICATLQKNDIRYFVVKGLSVAQCYPSPNLRTQGDIDILVPKNQFKESVSVLSARASNLEPFDEYLVHQGLWFGDIEVELHGSLHPKLGKIIDQVLDVNQAELFEGSLSFETFCAEYLFIHSLQHFHWTGLGIRQIMDWACWIRTNYNLIDWQRVSSDIIRMKLTKEWSIFECFVFKYLSISFGEAISRKETVIGEEQMLWESCKERGNMGKNKSSIVVRNFVKRNALVVWNILVQFNNMRKFSPHIRYNLMFVRFSVLFQQLGK